MKNHWSKKVATIKTSFEIPAFNCNEYTSNNTFYPIIIIVALPPCLNQNQIEENLNTGLSFAAGNGGSHLKETQNFFVLRTRSI